MSLTSVVAGWLWDQPDRLWDHLGRARGVGVGMLCGFKKIFVSYYQISISCFLIEIDPIFMVLKICLRESSALFGACLYGNCQYLVFISIISRFTNI